MLHLSQGRLQYPQPSKGWTRHHPHLFPLPLPPSPSTGCRDNTTLCTLPLAAYVQELKGKTIGTDEILRVLQTCYDREKEEEETVVANKVETAKGF
jgi:hypothetical protein